VKRGCIFAILVLCGAGGLAGRPRPAPSDDFETNYRLGEYYLHAGKLLAGIPYMQKAASLQPSNYVVGYDLALAWYETRNYAKAREQLQAMLARKDTAELHSLLADVEEASQDYVAALREYQRAAQMEPSEERIFDLGTELLVHQTFDPAIQVFARGAQLYPKSVKLNLGLGIADYLRGHYEEAVKALCTASDLAPAQSWPYLFLGRTYSGISQVSASGAEEVRKRLSRFAQLQPKNARALYYYAMSVPDPNRAEPLLRKAIALDPKFADAHLQLGILYADRQANQDAAREFERVIALQPSLTTAHYHLAQVYRRTGEAERAREELAIFERLHHQDAKQTEEERNEIKQFVVSMKEQ